MTQIVSYILDRIAALVREDEAQDGFEYLLVVGGISVAIIAAVVLASPGLINGVIEAVCGAINTVINPDIDCAAITP